MALQGSPVREGLGDKLFDLILGMINAKDLLIKNSTSVDATIIEFTTRPISKVKRATLKK